MLLLVPILLSKGDTMFTVGIITEISTPFVCTIRHAWCIEYKTASNIHREYRDSYEGIKDIQNSLKIGDTIMIPQKRK